LLLIAAKNKKRIKNLLISQNSSTFAAAYHPSNVQKEVGRFVQDALGENV
jgi:hypothetical protein